MANNAHVPKFGDWESEDIPYTACFDHARQLQATARPSGSVKIINPNDPEDNPEAFAAIMKTTMQIRSNSSDHHHDAASSASRRSHYSNRTTSSAAEKPRRGARNQRRGGGSNNDDNLISTNYINITGAGSESGTTERSSSDFSLLKKRQNDSSDDHRRVKGDDQRKSNFKSCSANGTTTQNSASSASEQWRRRDRRGTVANQPSDLDHKSHQRAPSVPKFGSWDVNDPKTGEGFTIIFNKVKEEKHINDSTKVPVMPPPPNYLNDQNKQGTFSCLSKICCCFFPS